MKNLIKVKWYKTVNGLATWGEFQDFYKQKCDIQSLHSSSGPVVYLGPDGEHMSFSRQQALAVGELLVYFGEHGILPEPLAYEIKGNVK